MLIKIKGKYDYIAVFEQGNGLLIKDKITGRTRTVIDKEMPNLNKYLDDYDKAVEKRLKQEGWK